MLCNAMACQGSIFHWAKDHRVHHKYSDTNADPHNAKRGFFFSHMGWMLVKKHPDYIEAVNNIDGLDLLQDCVVRFQLALYPLFDLYMAFIWPAQIAQFCWGEDFMIAFCIAGALRHTVVLHFTALVNSAAHHFGDKPYNPSALATENPIVSLLTVGEGWHSWHHKYPFDYAASEFGISSQFNPSKLVIDALALMGLVWGRKRGTVAWALARARGDRGDIASSIAPCVDSSTQSNH